MSGNKKLEIKLREARANDVEALKSLFHEVIPHTFVKEGLPSDHEDATQEIDYKINQLNEHLEQENETYYLLATIDDKIVGTIWYGEAGELIKEGSNGKLEDVGEIGTVFVLPDFQGKGVGKVLFDGMVVVLKDAGHTVTSLDSGYTHAKKVWTHLLGEPIFIIKDKWGEGYDHFIWEIKL